MDIYRLLLLSHQQSRTQRLFIYINKLQKVQQIFTFKELEPARIWLFFPEKWLKLSIVYEDSWSPFRSSVCQVLEPSYQTVALVFAEGQRCGPQLLHLLPRLFTIICPINTFWLHIQKYTDIQLRRRRSPAAHHSECTANSVHGSEGAGHKQYDFD